MRWWLTGMAMLPALCAQDTFVGAMGGISTLSADARSEGSPPERSSFYKPENGSAITVFAGRHFTDYISAQVSYGWNRNALARGGIDLAAGTSFQQAMRGTFHTFAIEAMAYFGPRSSRLRPYLSAGPSVLHLTAGATGPARTRGSPLLPPARVTAAKPGLRVAVGIDWQVAERFGLRYSFSETIQRNPISRTQSPPGERGLANFQNWWGFSWSF